MPKACLNFQLKLEETNCICYENEKHDSGTIHRMKTCLTSTLHISIMKYIIIRIPEHILFIWSFIEIPQLKLFITFEKKIPLIPCSLENWWPLAFRIPDSDMFRWISIISRIIWRQLCTFQIWRHQAFRIPEHDMFRWSFIVSNPLANYYHHLEKYLTSTLHFFNLDVIRAPESVMTSIMYNASVLHD